MAMGQNPVFPVNIPIPTKIGSKKGGAPTPKWYQNGFAPQPNGQRACQTQEVGHKWANLPPFDLVQGYLELKQMATSTIERRKRHLGLLRRGLWELSGDVLALD